MRGNLSWNLWDTRENTNYPLKTFTKVFEISRIYLGRAHYYCWCIIRHRHGSFSKYKFLICRIRVIIESRIAILFFQLPRYVCDALQIADVNVDGWFVYVVIYCCLLFISCILYIYSVHYIVCYIYIYISVLEYLSWHLNLFILNIRSARSYVEINWKRKLLTCIWSIIFYSNQNFLSKILNGSWFIDQELSSTGRY